MKASASRITRVLYPVVTAGVAAAAGTGALYLAPAFIPRWSGSSLPDRVAIHWGTDGRADGAVDVATLSLTMSAPWLVTCAIALVIGLSAGRYRVGRAAIGAILGAGAGLFGGIAVSTVMVNLGATDWRRVTLPTWHVAMVLGAMGALGAVGWWLGRGAEPVGAAHGRAAGGGDDGKDDVAPSISLREGERTVWIGYCRNHRLLHIGGALTAASALTLLPVLLDPGRVGLVPVAVFAGSLVITMLALQAFSSARVRVDERGVLVRFGLLGLPVKRIPLDRIESARSAPLRPLQVGGWGYRIMPGRTAVMLRGGDCLVIQQSSGRVEFVVSVDDAGRGAALLNALRARCA